MGLLDINDDGVRLGLGLLAAAGPRADGAGFGQRLMGAVESFDQSKLRQQQLAQQQMQSEMMQAQLQDMRQKQVQQQQLRDLVKHYSLPAVVPGAPGTGQTNLVNDALPPDLRIGAQTALQARPAGFDREGFGRAYEAIDPFAGFDYQTKIAKDNSPLAVKADETLLDRHTLKPIFSNMKPAKPPTAVEEYQFARGQGYNGTFEQWDLARRRANASSTVVNMTDGQKGFDNEMKLGGAFKQEPIYKAHADVQSAFNQINASLQQGTPISDTAAATKIMKILDPGSVVRESELGMAMAAAGRMDRLKNYIDQSVSGTKLTPQQRVDFGNLAAELTAASAQTYNQKRSEYLQQGNDYGLNANRALGKPADVPKPTQAGDKLSITAPNGKTYTFANAKDLANFKFTTGIK